MPDLISQRGRSVAPHPVEDPRTAHLSRDSHGNVLGMAVFLNADDLRKLGIEIDSVGDERVSYQIVDGDFLIDADGEEASLHER